MGRMPQAVLVLFALAIPLVAPAADAPAPAPATPAPGTVLLDTYGFWRMHHTLAAPVIEEDGKLTPIEYGYQWMDSATPPPPADWTGVEFDDGSWLRGPARMSCRTPYLSKLCMRGYFSVADPSGANDLSLTILYQGGAVVYLNGKEIARGNVAAGKAMADSYPKEAFVTERGKILKGWEKAEKDLDAETLRRVDLKTRSLKDVRVPKEALRRGVNVLAVEILRAPYPPAVNTGQVPRGFATLHASRPMCLLEFNTCELIGVQLKAASAAGLENGAARLPGLRVWNSDVGQADFDLDFGGQGGEPLRPVKIVGVRNGAFDGKFVVGSTGTIRKLQVTVSDLAGAGGAKIASSAVQLRYGQPWGDEAGAFGLANYAFDKTVNGSNIFRYRQPPTLLGALFDAPPADVPVAATARSSRYFIPDTRLPASPAIVPGAVLPVWLTVRIPKDAAPGEYVGKATVQAEGAKPIAVPVVVKVADWTLPNPENYTAWIDLIESPDTLAVEYKAPLWSEEHWKLIDRSMDLLHGMGNKVLYLPLIVGTNMGNEQSLVRWIEKGGPSTGSGQVKYEYDLAILDKYLDHAVQHMGKPALIVLYAWDIYYAATKQLKPLNDDMELSKATMEAKRAFLGKGPLVTVVDASGKCEAKHLPLLTDPASKPIWQAMFAEVKRHIEKRGLWDRVMMGTMSDAWPAKAEVDFFIEVAGDLRWFSDSHMGVGDLTREMQVIASGKASKFTTEQVYPTVKNANDEITVLGKAAYSARVWSSIFGEQNKTGDSLLGWKRPFLSVQHDRHGNIHPMSRWRLMMEENVIGEQHGVGRLGGDWWSCVRDKNNRRAGLVRDRYPQSQWRNLDMNVQTMAPGPDGAVATHRFENLREGVQECEARIFIEKALDDPVTKGKVPADLAAKARELLRTRANWATKASSSLQSGGPDFFSILNARGWFQWPNLAGHCWWLSCNWQQQNEDLFTMAGKIAKAIK